MCPLRIQVEIACRICDDNNNKYDERNQNDNTIIENVNPQNSQPTSDLVRIFAN